MWGGSVTGGSVTGGSVTEGFVTGGSVTGGSVIGGVVTGGDVVSGVSDVCGGSEIPELDVVSSVVLSVIFGTEVVVFDVSVVGTEVSGEVIVVLMEGLSPETGGSMTLSLHAAKKQIRSIQIIADQKRFFISFTSEVSIHPS